MTGNALDVMTAQAHLCAECGRTVAEVEVSEESPERETECRESPGMAREEEYDGN
jgi:hypothetical protein